MKIPDCQDKSEDTAFRNSWHGALWGSRIKLMGPKHQATVFLTCIEKRFGMMSFRVSNI